MASCFLSTYVTLAAEKGIQLRRASVAAECRVNFSKTLGLSNDPIAEGVQFKVRVESDAPPDELRRLLNEAEQRCPAVYSLSNPVTVTSDLSVE